jgi:hypothetical protein
MIPNYSVLEKLAHEHRQTLLNEAGQKRRLAEAQHAPPLYSSRRLAARLRRYLILVGTRLQRAQAVE